MDDGHTSNTHELPCSLCNQLLLEQTCSTTFDTVQLFVHLVCAIESNIQDHIVRQGIECHRYQASIYDSLPRMVPRWHEQLLRRIWSSVYNFLDLINHENNSCTRSDTDVAKGWREVVGDGAGGREGFGLFYFGC